MPTFASPENIHNLKTKYNNNDYAVLNPVPLDAIKITASEAIRSLFFIGLYLYPLLFQSSLNLNQSFPKGESGLA